MQQRDFGNRSYNNCLFRTIRFEIGFIFVFLETRSVIRMTTHLIVGFYLSIRCRQCVGGGVTTFKVLVIQLAVQNSMRCFLSSNVSLWTVLSNVHRETFILGYYTLFGIENENYVGKCYFETSSNPRYILEKMCLLNALHYFKLTFCS